MGSLQLFLMSLYSLLFGGNYAPPVQHLKPGGICSFILKAPGKSHNLFMLEAVGEKAASYVMSTLTNTYMHTHKHSQAYLFFFFFLTHIPRNCTSFHFHALQALFKASQTHSNICLSLTFLLFTDHVCRSNTSVCDRTGPEINVVSKRSCSLSVKDIYENPSCPCDFCSYHLTVFMSF